MAPPHKSIDRELDRMRHYLRAEIKEIDEEIIALRARADALRRTLTGIEETLGVKEERPKGADAVARVILERDEPLTVAEIVEELAHRGWLPDSQRPEGAVRSAMKRLRHADDRWTFYRGRLYFVPESDEERAAQHDAARDSYEGEED